MVTLTDKDGGRSPPYPAASPWIAMRVTYSDDRLAFDQPTVFLAGPTPRRRDVVSWRVEAVELLKRLGFGGTVLVPERPDFASRFDYTDQVEWEFEGLE